MNNINVLIGYFQVPDFSDTDLEALNHIIEEYPNPIIFLVVPKIRSSKKNPLSFIQRKQLLDSCFNDITVLPIEENTICMRKEVKSMVAKIAPLDVITYHVQDKLDRCPGDTVFSLEGTGINVHRTHKQFRAGVIEGVRNRWDTSFQTVDIAMFNDKGEVALIRKADRELWQFPGGFVEPKHYSLEYAAQCEVTEECGVESGDFEYVGSFRIADSRYEGETDQVLTALFTAKYVFGNLKAGDDAAEVDWFSLAELDTKLIQAHKCLYKALVGINKQP